MNRKRKQFKTVLLLIVLLVFGLISVTGCKKSEPTEPPTPAAVSEKPVEIAAETIEQTTCPVMGGPVNKDFYTEYKGKKVYFCCAGCKEKFEADPEQYLSKLPQFQR